MLKNKLGVPILLVKWCPCKNFRNIQYYNSRGNDQDSNVSMYVLKCSYFHYQVHVSWPDVSAQLNSVSHRAVPEITVLFCSTNCQTLGLSTQLWSAQTKYSSQLCHLPKNDHSHINETELLWKEFPGNILLKHSSNIVLRTSCPLSGLWF